MVARVTAAQTPPWTGVGCRSSPCNTQFCGWGHVRWDRAALPVALSTLIPVFSGFDFSQISHPQMQTAAKKKDFGYLSFLTV